MNEPRHEYQRRLANWDARIARGERTHWLLSNLRLTAAANVPAVTEVEGETHEAQAEGSLRPLRVTTTATAQRVEPVVVLD